MLSLTASNDAPMHSSDESPADKRDANGQFTPPSGETSKESIKRPSLSPQFTPGPLKSPRIQEFQPLKCRCGRSFVGIAEFVLHAQTCVDLVTASTENAVDLSFSNAHATIKSEGGVNIQYLPRTDALDLTVRGTDVPSTLCGNSSSTQAFTSLPNPTLTCPECKVSTFSHMQLLRHFESAHGAYGNYSCSCGIEFEWLPAFLSHYLLCPTVTTRKPSPILLENSYSQKPLPLPCKPAPKSTPVSAQPDLTRPFRCCHCVKSFKSKALLDQHMHIHYPPKYTCRYCAKKYRWPPVFYHHQRTCKKRPPTAPSGGTANASSSSRSNMDEGVRTFVNSSANQSQFPPDTYPFPLPHPPPPPPPQISMPNPFLFCAPPVGDMRPRLLLAPPAFPKSWDRKEFPIFNLNSLRLPPFPLPLGAHPDLLRFQQQQQSPLHHPSSGLPPQMLPPNSFFSLPHPKMPFITPFSIDSIAGAEKPPLTATPITCTCGSTFESPQAYLAHIGGCHIFEKLLGSHPVAPTHPATPKPHQLPDDPLAAHPFSLTNILSLLEKCKPEFFQQYLLPPQKMKSPSLGEPGCSNGGGGGVGGGGGNLCDQCGKEFSSRLSLKQHVEGKHSTEGKYQCPGCAKRYRWGASYYYHKKSCPAVAISGGDCVDEDEGIHAESSSSPGIVEDVVSAATLLLQSTPLPMLKQEQQEEVKEEEGEDRRVEEEGQRRPFLESDGNLVAERLYMPPMSPSKDSPKHFSC